MYRLMIILFKSIALNIEAYALKIENRKTNALNVETNVLVLILTLVFHVRVNSLLTRLM